jgi:hypothetical protein
MQRNAILDSVRPMKTTTSVLAWTFQIGKDTYQVCEYDSRWTGPRAGIWRCSRNGSKRLSEQLYECRQKDHQQAIREWLDIQELAEIDAMEPDADTGMVDTEE